MTPDFRLQLISPGTFHLAISVAPSGNTCVRTLPGNDAAVFVAELMGNDSYQLSPGKSVMFAGGKISAATAAPEVCGCPETAAPIRTPETAVATAPGGSPAQPTVAQPTEAPPTEKQTSEAPALAEQAAAAHLEVDSRFVYRGDKAVQDISSSVSRLSLSTDNSKLALALLPQVSGPPAPAPVAKKSGFLHWLGHVFGR
jgi:hypothetical protein